MPEGFDQLAKGVGKAIETVPDLYTDALQPTTQESGKTLSLIPRTINAALVPLRQWIAEREYNLAETEKLLAQKLEHVGEDKIVTPEPYVAVPAIQAISYCKNSNELRDLYANLLAKAMNSDTKDLVHPSFVEIIKQILLLCHIICSPFLLLIVLLYLYSMLIYIFHRYSRSHPNRKHYLFCLLHSALFLVLIFSMQVTSEHHHKFL